MSLLAAASRLDRDLREGSVRAAFRSHARTVVVLGSLAGVLLGQGVGYLAYKIAHRHMAVCGLGQLGTGCQPSSPKQSVTTGGVSGLLAGAVMCALAVVLLRRRAARVTTP